MNEVDKATADYANMLYSNLRKLAPRDTGNMMRNIEFRELPDRYVIIISTGVPYARYVNENWGKRSKASQTSYMKRKRPVEQKEKRNYHWVERTIESTSRAMFGGYKYEWFYKLFTRKTARVNRL